MFKYSNIPLQTCFFFFSRTFFSRVGLIGAVLLGSFQACAIYIPAALLDIYNSMIAIGSFEMS